LRAGLDILRRADLRESAGRIGIPTLVVAGEHDRLTLPGAASWLAGHIPGARLVMIPGAGHAPFLSHPERCQAACLEFLDPAHARRLHA
jgi:pimeloyl-[acyl-carrier protein] methyl ester esterase